MKYGRTYVGFFACHAMEHALSAYYGHYSRAWIGHRNSPLVYTYILNETTAPAIFRLGVKVFCISENLDKMSGAKKAIEAVSNFCFDTLGLKANLSDFGIDEKYFKDIALFAISHFQLQTHFINRFYIRRSRFSVLQLHRKTSMLRHEK